MLATNISSPAGKVFAIAITAGLLATAVHKVAAQTERPQSPPNREGNIQVEVNSPTNEQAGQRGKSAQQLDAFIAATLAVETESAAELSQVVANQAKDSEVGQFAEQAASELKSQAERLRSFASLRNSQPSPQQPTARQSADPNQPDLSATAQELGQDIRERLQERRAESGRRAPADRQAQQTRDDRRANRPRVVLPAIRNNLPQILELAGEALEQGANDNAPSGSRIELVVAIAEETLSAKEQELAKYQGEAYEQAYLGMIVDAGLEIESAAVAAAPMASGSLREALEDAEQTAAELTEQARRKMTQGTDVARRDTSRSGAAADNSSQRTVDGQQ